MLRRPRAATTGSVRPSIVDLLDDVQLAVLVEALRALVVSAAKNRAARLAAARPLDAGPDVYNAARGQRAAP